MNAYLVISLRFTPCANTAQLLAINSFLSNVIDAL